MNRITSFSAASSPDATVLILGSIPGKASLEANRYYAHPQNQFWPIITELLELNPSSSYLARIESLKLAGIALWDVVKSCHRHNSSLDAKIDKNSIVTNDFPGFFLNHPYITHIFFNGLTAEKNLSKACSTLYMHRSVYVPPITLYKPGACSDGFSTKAG